MAVYGRVNTPAPADSQFLPHFQVRLADGLEQDKVGVTVVFRHTAHLLRILDFIKPLQPGISLFHILAFQQIAFFLR